MNGVDDQFERRVRAGLSALAEEAPDGPDAGRVAARLRRRKRKRVALGATLAGAMAVVLIAAAVRMTGDPPGQRPGSPTRLVKAPPGLLGPARTVTPIGVHADQAEIESAVRGYFASIGAGGRALVTKRPGEGLSYVLGGGSAIGSEQVASDLDVLFGNFDSVNVNVQNGDMSYSLLALPRAAGPS